MEEINVPGGGATLRKYKRRDIVNASIILNYAKHVNSRLTNRQLADQLSVPIQVIYDQTNRLRSAGKLPASKAAQRSGMEPIEHPERIGRAVLPATGLFSLDALLEKVQAGGSLTAEERKFVLSNIAIAGADQHRILAARAIDEMETATVRGVGPTPPISDIEAAQRLARMMAGLGKLTVLAALRIMRRVPEPAGGISNGAGTEERAIEPSGIKAEEPALSSGGSVTTGDSSLEGRSY